MNEDTTVIPVPTEQQQITTFANQVEANINDRVAAIEATINHLISKFFGSSVADDIVAIVNALPKSGA